MMSCGGTVDDAICLNVMVKYGWMTSWEGDYQWMWQWEGARVTGHGKDGVMVPSMDGIDIPG